MPQSYRLTFTFDEAQDIEEINIAFYKGDERTRTFEVETLDTSGDTSTTEFTSSGETDGFETFSLGSMETTELVISPASPNEDDWISIFEVGSFSFSPSNAVDPLILYSAVPLLNKCALRKYQYKYSLDRLWFYSSTRHTTNFRKSCPELYNRHLFPPVMYRVNDKGGHETHQNIANNIPTTWKKRMEVYLYKLH